MRAEKSNQSYLAEFLLGTEVLEEAYAYGQRSTILAPGQNLLLLQQAKEFAQVASEGAACADETGMVDQCVWSAFHDSGLSMAVFDPAFGGSGLCEPDQQTTLCSILRLIGGADLSVARLFEGHVNAVMLVLRYGTTTQIESLASSVKDGGLSGVWERKTRTACGLSAAANLGRWREARSSHPVPVP